MPKLKPATINAKIDTLNTELSELQYQRQQLLDSASDTPLIGQYLATKKSGGTAFARKAEKQVVHDYYALVDAAGVFIRYVGKHEVSAYRDRIRLGKKVSKINRAISRCAKRINKYKSKLPPTGTIKSLRVAAPGSQTKSRDSLGDESEGSGAERRLHTIQYADGVTTEAA